MIIFPFAKKSLLWKALQVTGVYPWPGHDYVGTFYLIDRKDLIL